MAHKGDVILVDLQVGLFSGRKVEESPSSSTVDKVDKSRRDNTGPVLQYGHKTPFNFIQNTLMGSERWYIYIFFFFYGRMEKYSEKTASLSKIIIIKKNPSIWRLKKKKPDP